MNDLIFLLEILLKYFLIALAFIGAIILYLAILNNMS